MRLSRRTNMRIAALAVIGAAALAGCGADNGGGSSQKAGAGSSGTGAASGGAGKVPNVKDLCGHKDITIAQIDGFGANAWRKITRAELTDEVSACPNVKVEYAQAGGDVQKYVTQINAFLAKGVDAIVTYDDFGPQGLSALSRAKRAGVVVVPYIASPGGQVGQDYNAFVDLDRAGTAKRWASWMNDVLGGKGNLLFIGGVPGNPSSPAYLNPFMADIKSDPGLKFLSDKPVDTNWDPAQEQRVMAGLISKYPKIDGLLSDYGIASVGGIRAFVNANKPHPPLATLASSNELGCMWQKYKDKWPNFQILSVDGSTRAVRIAARKALAAVNGLKDDEPNIGPLIVSIDTRAGKAPCDASLPPDADLSSSLSKDQLKALFK
jgi:ribose transport system substrate-binding protein